MLEAVISKFLMRYLKKYIETLDSSQMEMELWKGIAKFENLRILPNALSIHQLPFTVKGGTIKSAKFIFPWKNLSKDACILEVTDVFLLLGIDGSVLIKSDIRGNQDAFHIGENIKNQSKEEESSTIQNILDTIFDNLQININNIHARIEIPHHDSVIAIGINISNVTLFTIDEEKKPILTLIKRGDSVRKNLQIKGISIYFDTITEPVNLYNLIQEMYIHSNSLEHQFVINPFNIDCIINHDRSASSTIKNTLEAVLSPVTITLDFMQSRAIIDLRDEWNMFNKRRKYSHCIRPDNFEAFYDLWGYINKCAYTKAKPHCFKPCLGISILKNRKLYLKLFGEKNNVISLLFKSQKFKTLDSLEKHLGSEASFFLKGYADIIIQKEKLSESQGISSLDIKELKGVISSNDAFFSTKSFLLTVSISQFNMELVYTKDTPLFKIELEKIVSTFSNINGSISFISKLSTMRMNSFEGSSSKLIFHSMNKASDYFILIDGVCVTNQSPLQINMQIAPMGLSFEESTLIQGIDFFSPKERSNQEKTITRVDAAEQMQSLLYLKNVGLYLDISRIDYSLPYENDGNEKSMVLSLSNLVLNKKCGSIIPISAESFVFPIHFSYHLNHISINKFNIIDNIEFSTIWNFELFHGVMDSNISVESEISPIVCIFDFQIIEEILSFIGYIKSFLNSIKYSHYQNQTAHTTLVSYARIKFFVCLIVPSIVISFKDKIVLFMFSLNSTHFILNQYRNLVNYSISIDDIFLKWKDIDILSIKCNDQRKGLFLEYIIEKHINKLGIQNPQISVSNELILYLMSFFVSLNITPSSSQVKEKNNEVLTSFLFQIDDLTINYLLPEFSSSFHVGKAEIGIMNSSAQVSIYDYRFGISDHSFLIGHKIIFELITQECIPNLIIIVFPIDLNLSLSVLNDLSLFYKHITAVLPRDERKSMIDLSAKINGFNLYFQDKNELLCILSIYDADFSAKQTSGFSNLDLRIHQIEINSTNNRTIFLHSDIPDPFLIKIIETDSSIDFNFQMFNVFFLLSNELIEYIRKNMVSSKTSSSEIQQKPLNFGVLIKSSNFGITQNQNILFQTSLFDASLMMKNQYREFIFEICNFLIVTPSKEIVLDLGSKIICSRENSINLCKSSGIKLFLSIYILDSLISLIHSLYPSIANNSVRFKNTGVSENICIFFIEFELSADDLLSDICLKCDQIDVSVGSVTQNNMLFVQIKNLGLFYSTKRLDSSQFNDSNPLLHSKTKYSLNITSFWVYYSHSIAFIIQNLIRSIEFNHRIEENGNIEPLLMSIFVSIDSFHLSIYNFDEIAHLCIHMIKFCLESLTCFHVSLSRIEIIDEKNSFPIPIIDKFDENEVLSINYVSDNYQIVSSTLSFFIDYQFFNNLFSYLLRSPFLQTNQDSSNQSFKRVFLSFSFPSISIIMPSSIKAKNDPYLLIKASLIGKVSSSLLELTISSFSLNFHDLQMRYNYNPILSEISSSFIMKKLDDSTQSYFIGISQALISLSPVDIVLFSQIIDHISQIRIEMNDGENKIYKELQNHIIEIKFTSDETQLIICKDNRASSYHVPIFRFVIPPIDFLLSSSQTVGSAKLVLSPYLEGFNDMTGHWDMIVEPFILNVGAMLTSDSFEVICNTTNILNINLPMYAIKQYNEVWKAIQDNMKNSSLKYIEMPMFWLQNNLGHHVSFTLGDIDNTVHNLDAKMIVLGHGEIIPVFGITMDTKIDVNLIDKHYVFVPLFINYPTYISPLICVIRKPYNGGILLQLEAPFQLVNQLMIPFDLFVYNDESSQYVHLKKLNTMEHYPLFYTNTKPKQYILSGGGKQIKEKHQIISVSISNIESAIFQMLVDDSRMYCLKKFQIDQNSGTKQLIVTAPFKATSYLPIPIYFRFVDSPISYTLKCDTYQDLLFINPSQKKTKVLFSLDGIEFGPPQILSIISTTPQTFIVFDPLSESNINVTISIETDSEGIQKTLVFYSPVVIFNLSTFSIKIKENIPKGFMEKIVEPDGFLLWNTVNYSKEEDIKNVLISALSESYVIEDPLDFLVSTNRILWLPTNINDSYVSIRYDVTKKGNVSIVTFTNSLSIKNELGIAVALQPILEIPNSFGKEAEYIGLSSRSELVGSPYLLEPGKNTVINEIPKSGSFMISVFGYSSTPVLSLLTVQNTVFRVQSMNKYLLIHLCVTDTNHEFSVVIRKSQFPTPIMVTNDLDNTEISVYQVISMAPFIIKPYTTSTFAYDEPFAYPFMNVFYNNMKIQISLIEDTEPIPLDHQINGKQVIVTISRNPNGTRSVVLSHSSPKSQSLFTRFVSFKLTGLAISLIDLQMKEVILLSISSIETSITRSESGSVAKISFDSVQIDDQNNAQVSPIMLFGKNSDEYPFLQIQLYSPSNRFFDVISYASIATRRLDVQIDSSMISDIYSIIQLLSIEKSHVISPKKKRVKGSGLDDITTLGWVEISPIFISFSYNKTSSRPPSYGPALKYLKFIPSIKSQKLLLPGIIMAQTTDRPKKIFERLKSDYKTALFHQVISSLGVSGKIMNSFGVSGAIASMLNIKLVSEMSSEVPSFARLEEAIFDNRKEINGWFSQQTLMSLCIMLESFQIPPSDLILRLLAGADVGLQMKASPGCGFGNGILGVVTKASIDTSPLPYILDENFRRRMPRAFPNNEIAIYDEAISLSQNLIQRRGTHEMSHSEKIRIILKCIKSNNNICISDHFVFILSQNLDHIMNEVLMSQIQSVIIQSSDVTIEGKLSSEKLLFRCKNEEFAMKVKIFIDSQRKMIMIFGRTML